MNASTSTDLDLRNSRRFESGQTSCGRKRLDLDGIEKKPRHQRRDTSPTTVDDVVMKWQLAGAPRFAGPAWLGVEGLGSGEQGTRQGVANRLVALDPHWSGAHHPMHVSDMD